METIQPTLTQLNQPNQPTNPLSPPVVTPQPAPVTPPQAPASPAVQAQAPVEVSPAVPALTAPNEPQDAATYVNHRDFQVGKLSCTPAEKKQIPGSGKDGSPAQYYHQIPLMYNYGTDDKRLLDDFLLEGCEMTSKGGIQSKQGQSGRMEYSIMVSYDTNNVDQSQFLDCINKVHGGAAYILGTMKGAVGMHEFQVNLPTATGFKNPIYRPRDEMTGELIQGRQPSSFWKLFQRGKPPMGEQTLFTDPDGKPIPWSLLSGVELKFIPLIHIKRIYIGGGKASLQMELISAVVTLARPRNTATRQVSTLNQLKENRPQLSDQVAAQLAKLTAERQDQMLGNVPPAIEQPQQQEGSGQQPTFAGITPTGARAPAVPSMQEFTSNAPVRAPVIPVTANAQAPQTPSPTMKLS